MRDCLPNFSRFAAQRSHAYTLPSLKLRKMRLLTVYIQLKLRKMISAFCSRPPYNAALETAEKCT